MAAITNLVLNNGTSDVTFQPSSKKGNVVTWTAPAESVALMPRISSDAYPVTSTQANRRIKYTVAFPILSTSINDVKSIETGHLNLDLKVPQVMTTAQLKQLRTLLSNLLINSLIIDQIDNGNNPY